MISAKPKVPEGLRGLMEAFTKEVLREKPENIYDFSLNYFQNLLKNCSGYAVKDYEQFNSFDYIYRHRDYNRVPVANVFKIIPKTLTELITNFLKAVLKENPQNICEFGVDYFKSFQKTLAKNENVAYTSYDNYFRAREHNLLRPFFKCKCNRSLQKYVKGDNPNKETNQNSTRDKHVKLSKETSETLPYQVNKSTYRDKLIGNSTHHVNDEIFLRSAYVIQRFCRNWLKTKHIKSSSSPNGNKTLVENQGNVEAPQGITSTIIQRPIPMFPAKKLPENVPKHSKIQIFTSIPENEENKGNVSGAASYTSDTNIRMSIEMVPSSEKILLERLKHVDEQKNIQITEKAMKIFNYSSKELKSSILKNVDDAAYENYLEALDNNHSKDINDSSSNINGEPTKDISELNFTENIVLHTLQRQHENENENSSPDSMLSSIIVENSNYDNFVVSVASDAIEIFESILENESDSNTKLESINTSTLMQDEIPNTSFKEQNPKQSINSSGVEISEKIHIKNTNIADNDPVLNDEKQSRKANQIKSIELSDCFEAIEPNFLQSAGDDGLDERKKIKGMTISQSNSNIPSRTEDFSCTDEKQVKENILANFKIFRSDSKKTKIIQPINNSQGNIVHQCFAEEATEKILDSLTVPKNYNNYKSDQNFRNINDKMYDKCMHSSLHKEIENKQKSNDIQNFPKKFNVNEISKDEIDNYLISTPSDETEQENLLNIIANRAISTEYFSFDKLPNQTNIYDQNQFSNQSEISKDCNKDIPLEVAGFSVEEKELIIDSNESQIIINWTKDTNSSRIHEIKVNCDSVKTLNTDELKKGKRKLSKLETHEKYMDEKQKSEHILQYGSLSQKSINDNLAEPFKLHSLNNQNTEVESRSSEIPTEAFSELTEEKSFNRAEEPDKKELNTSESFVKQELYAHLKHASEENTLSFMESLYDVNQDKYPMLKTISMSTKNHDGEEEITASAIIKNKSNQIEIRTEEKDRNHHVKQRQPFLKESQENDMNQAKIEGLPEKPIDSELDERIEENKKTHSYSNKFEKLHIKKEPFLEENIKNEFSDIHSKNTKKSLSMDLKTEVFNEEYEATIPKSLDHLNENKEDRWEKEYFKNNKDDQIAKEFIDLHCTEDNFLSSPKKECDGTNLKLELFKNSKECVETVPKESEELFPSNNHESPIEIDHIVSSLKKSMCLTGRSNKSNKIESENSDNLEIFLKISSDFINSRRFQNTYFVNSVSRFFKIEREHCDSDISHLKLEKEFIKKISTLKALETDTSFIDINENESSPSSNSTTSGHEGLNFVESTSDKLRSSHHFGSTVNLIDDSAFAEVTFDEPFIRLMKKIDDAPSSSLEDEAIVLKPLNRKTTRESEDQSYCLVYGSEVNSNIEKQCVKTLLQRNYTIPGNDPMVVFNQITINEKLTCVEPQETEITGSINYGFCVDYDTSENIRQKMMACSLSEVESECLGAENIDASGNIDNSRLLSDDFNLALENMKRTSTETESTIVSAATKIQAGARGFLTRRRLKRSSFCTKASFLENNKTSFGNSAIGESLERRIEEGAAKKIQAAYRKYCSKRKISSKQKGQAASNSVDKCSENDLIESKGNSCSSFEAALAARRHTLQRGDAMHTDSAADDEILVSPDLARSKNCFTPQTKEIFFKEDKNDVAKTGCGSQHNCELKWKALRQHSMPVQIESEIFRVIPNHMRKRISSAGGENKRGPLKNN